MKRVWPRCPCTEEDRASWGAPQGPVRSHAKRPRLQEPARLQPQAQPVREAPERHPGQEPSCGVFLPAGYNFEPHLENFGLLLQPKPITVLQASFQGHNIMLIPEDLQASIHPGQPGFFPPPQGAVPLNMPHHHVFLIQPGPLSASGSHSGCLGNTSNPHQHPQGRFLMPWMNVPAGLVPGLLLSYSGVSSPLYPGHAPDPGPPLASPSALIYAPSSIWSLHSNRLCPLPSSPLQPLPPSPPETQPQPLQRPQRPSRLPCKAQRRLF